MLCKQAVRTSNPTGLKHRLYIGICVDFILIYLSRSFLSLYFPCEGSEQPLHNRGDLIKNAFLAGEGGRECFGSSFLYQGL